MPDNDRPFLSRPKDRSLQAFKEWMLEIGNLLLPASAPKKTLTDDEWEDL